MASNHLHKFTSIIIFIILSTTTFAQGVSGNYSWDDFVQSYINEELFPYDDGSVDTEKGEDDDYREDVVDMLYNIHLHPIQLNACTAEQLSVLPFINENQAKDIVFYISMYGPMRSLGELMFINSLDFRTRQWLSLFVCTDNVDTLPKKEISKRKQSVFKPLSHDIKFRTEIPLYTKQGYKQIPDSVYRKYPNRVYQGNNNHHSLQYMVSSSHFYGGIQTEKDAGEDMFDFVSGYLMLKDLNSLKYAVVGDYRIGMGQGLVVNNGYSSNIIVGKVNLLNDLNHNLTPSVNKHSSKSESNFFRGAAVQMTMPDFGMPDLHSTLTAFISYRHADGTLLSDSSGISSLKTDGLHRTLGERSKKNIFTDLSMGGNLTCDYTFQSDKYHSPFRVALGLSFISTKLSIPLRPVYNTEYTKYRLYNLQGDSFSAYGISYALYGTFSNRYILSLKGETAVNKSQITGMSGLATINVLQLKYKNKTTFTLSWRDYSERYSALYAKSLSEYSGSPQNEGGLFIGIKYPNIPFLSLCSLESYIDFFHSPWRRYQVSDSSAGIDAMVRLTYPHSSCSTWDVRYRIKSREKDCSLSVDGFPDSVYKALGSVVSQNVRVSHSWDVAKRLSIRSVLYGVSVFHPVNGSDMGVALSEYVSFSDIFCGRGSAAASLTLFCTDGYGSRVFAYEPSGGSIGSGGVSVYGQGFRCCAVVRSVWGRMKRLKVGVKVGWTRVFDRDQLGSGLETVDSAGKVDVGLWAELGL